MAAGFLDLYHSILVGPCRPGVVEVETAACRLLEEIDADAGTFDCSHEEWVRLFRDDAQRAAHGAGPGSGRGLDADDDIALADGYRVQSAGGRWVALDPAGRPLRSLGEADAEWGKASTPVGPSEDCLRFTHPATALQALLRAAALVAAEVRRRSAALRLLGRDDFDGAPDEGLAKAIREDLELPMPGGKLRGAPGPAAARPPTPPRRKSEYFAGIDALREERKGTRTGGKAEPKSGPGPGDGRPGR